MNFLAASLSESGPRSVNEDAIGVWDLGEGRLAVAVADGLGGHFGGKWASRLAIESFGEAVCAEQNLDLEQVALDIHEKIREEQRRQPELRSMATTLSAALVTEGVMNFVHCGDSRIAIARGDGIRRLTIDHSEAQRLFSAGKLTKEQFLVYPRKNILESALGIKDRPLIDVASFQLKPGDRIFFSTDGFHNKILIRELLSLVKGKPTPDEAVAALRVEMEARDPDDNYSLVCVYASQMA